MPPRPHLSLPSPGSRRAVVVWAGSFGTAVALEAAALEAPVTHALNRLIAGDLPLDEWVAQVRATVPAPARFHSGALWRRWWWRVRHQRFRRAA